MAKAARVKKVATPQKDVVSANCIRPETNRPKKPVGANRIRPTAKTASKSRDGSREYGFMLYMQRISQMDIALRCGVSAQTVTDWKKKDNWEAKRGASNISIATIVNKAMVKIDEMLSADDFNADAFSKAVAQLKTLKQRNTVDDEIMCFLDFQNWLMERRQSIGIDGEFIKTLTKLQDSFIQFRIGNV